MSRRSKGRASLPVILALLTAQLLSPLLLLSPVMGLESTTKFGLNSFTMAGVTRSDLSYDITLNYDASQAGNPWQGGIYGYGEIEKLTRWDATAYFFEDEVKAGELASAGWTGFGSMGDVIGEAPDRITMGVIREETGGWFDGTEPLTGTIEGRIDLPRYVVDHIRQGETFHVVFMAQISYRAFNGNWANVAVSGPAQLGGEDEKITVRADGPTGIARGTSQVTFTAQAGGREQDKISKFGWNFQYRREDGTWGGLDYISTEKSRVTINSTDGQPNLDHWRNRVETIGVETPQGKQLAMRATVSVYIGSTKIVTSDPHDFVTSLADRTLTVTGPGTITGETDRAIFTATGDFEADRVDWSFSYRNGDGEWMLLDSARTKSLGDLTINKTTGRVNLDRWIKIARALSPGNQEPRPLEARVSVKAYMDGEPLAESEPHDFIVSAEKVSFDIAGPATITDETEDAEFRVVNLVDEDGEVESIEWSFEYRNRTGHWIDIGSTEKKAAEAMKVPKAGEAINLDVWRSVALIHGDKSGGTITLGMNLTAHALSSDHRFLASAWHEFSVKLERENRYRIMGLRDLTSLEDQSKLEFPMKRLKLEFKQGSVTEVTQTDADGYYQIPQRFWDTDEKYELYLHLAYVRDSLKYFTINGDEGKDDAIRIRLDIEENRITSAEILVRQGVGAKIETAMDLGPVLYLDQMDPGAKNIYSFYIHMTEAFEFYNDHLGEDMKFRLPLVVLPWNNGPTLYDPGLDRILISVDHTSYSSPTRPKGREYHEFSHYAMHAIYGELPSSPPGPIKDKNHDGYLNPTTADSWAEGFAHFMGMIIGEHYGNWWNSEPHVLGLHFPHTVTGENVPIFSCMMQSMKNLENNYLAWGLWGHHEELAVAGILWDLYDGEEQYRKRNDLKLVETLLDEGLYDRDGDNVLNATELMIMHLDYDAIYQYELVPKSRSLEESGLIGLAEKEGGGDLKVALEKNVDRAALYLFIWDKSNYITDENGDGRYDRNEAKVFMEGEGLSEQEFNSWFAQNDPDGDGYLQTSDLFLDDSNLSKALKHDLDGDGMLSRSEFTSYAGAEGISEEAADGIFGEFDDHPGVQGKLEFDEILRFNFRNLKIEDLEIPLSVIIDQKCGAEDDDGVDLSFDDMWSILREKHNDFYSVYLALVEKFPSIKAKIDRVFIDHGFFVDKDEGNGIHDSGEPYRDENDNGKYDEGEYFVDYPRDFSYNEAIDGEVGRATNYQRQERRHTVEIPGQFVKTNVDSPYYLVKVGFQSQPYIYERYPRDSYTFITHGHDGLVYVPVPPEDYEAWITVVPLGVETRNPLVFKSEDYYAAATDSIENGYFLEYDFETAGEVATLPDEYDFPHNYSKPDHDGDESDLPGWFTENLPFLMPLIDPFLPYIPNGLLPIVPYAIIATPVILILIAASAIRSRGRRKAVNEEGS